MEFLFSLLRRHFGKKPVVASRNVDCFLYPSQLARLAGECCSFLAAVFFRRSRKSVAVSLLGMKVHRPQESRQPRGLVFSDHDLPGRSFYSVCNLIFYPVTNLCTILVNRKKLPACYYSPCNALVNISIGAHF